jgi:hypothetical protein
MRSRSASASSSGIESVANNDTLPLSSRNRTITRLTRPEHTDALLTGKIAGVSGYHLTATICRRGHVVTTNADSALHTPRCATCGAETLIACPNCGARIRGAYIVPGFIGVGEDYTPPDFCADCGSPFPWASRQARIYELMNLLDEEQLDPAAELAVREQLEALANTDLDEQDQEGRWRRVQRLAPTLWEKAGAQQIITTLVLAEARARLGLPPA